ncbi:uncharacterized protein LOC129589329 [Paramacrobiotus metropolitanus]|uniref:uncharacterized protein LOC129589329 n=1 Tax=Paramacrobiotus metropolitanus TaxID=2943436 RepID=UPI002445FA20|nr:uncharacterized protein LOC129589329 [Paramacrobiotus metropolitanus]XP_055340013.1 uncharacterized protein LOC129589329 [Paramacrobiotus metropolitanus]XP_055340014.1 uncharacterized protein LOC129589329 [Paramacrobiotus metropolitanus]XP_055340015.1 uncharacterized protein LOC129589329 [Paramacrobiotus metropolitanus]
MDCQCSVLFIAVVFSLYCQYLYAQEQQCPAGEDVSFVLLTSHKMHTVDPLSSVLTFNLSACIDGCINDPNCQALNIQNSPKNEFCSYYSKSASVVANGTMTPDDLAIFYLEKKCLKGACQRLFAFELVTGKDLERAPDTVIKGSTEKTCLESCLAWTQPPCLSATFDVLSGDCALRNANRFTHPTDFKDTNKNVRYFDNNCRDELPANVSYDIVTRNLATHFSDTDYVDISLAECAKLCHENPDYPCRAFFFGETILGRFCGLMHLPVAAVAQIPGGIFPIEGVNMYEPAVSKGCPSDAVNFVLMSAQSIAEDPASSSPLSNPSLCIDQCRQNSRCVGLTVDYANAKCNFYTQYKSDSIQNDGMVSIYLKICLDSPVSCKRDWAFERIDGQTLLTFDKRVEAFSARQCMLACLEEHRFQCKAFDYNSLTNECQLSRLDRHSVNYKQMDLRDLVVPTRQAEITLYENNCYQEPTQFCFFDPVKDVDISLHDALVVDGISSEEDCKKACQQQTGFNCRRYAFVSNSICMLTHYTKATAPQVSILRHESQSVYGEVTTCYNVSVECGSTMIAHVKSNREYDGMIYAKGKADVGDCAQVVKQQFSFDLNLPLNIRTVESCNTFLEDEGQFHNTIVLQHNAHVLTAMDQTFGLQCKYDLRAKEELTNLFNVNFSLGVLPEASKSVVRHTVKMPKITMRILGLDGEEISEAELGSELIVRIDMEDSEDVFGLSIHNMFATDGRRKNNMTLVDVKGCPAENLIRNFRQINPKTLEARMEVFAFPDNNRIIIDAEVQTCRFRCKPVICGNGAESYGKRKRRAADGAHEGGDAIARDTLRKTVTITSQKFTLPLNSEKSLKISISGVREGEPAGISCFLPQILAVLTVCWFIVEMTAISCICFLKRKINYFREKVKNAEGFYSHGPYVTYATVTRRNAVMSSVPMASDSAMGSSAC